MRGIVRVIVAFLATTALLTIFLLFVVSKFILATLFVPIVIYWLVYTYIKERDMFLEGIYEESAEDVAFRREAYRRIMMDNEPKDTDDK